MSTQSSLPLHCVLSILFYACMSTNKRRRSSYTPNSLLALSWLGSDHQGASILTTAHDLLAAQNVIDGSLPPGLAGNCRAARMENGVITLTVPAAAHANKLRHLQTRLVSALHDAGWNINSVQIRVQGALGAHAPTRMRDVNPLDEHALQAFGSLKENLSPGPLADAVERLLARHSKKR